MLCFLDGHGLSELRGAIEILSSLRRMCTVKVFNGMQNALALACSSRWDDRRREVPRTWKTDPAKGG